MRWDPRRFLRLNPTSTEISRFRELSRHRVNIQKLRGKLEKDPEQFSTLQKMIGEEIAKKTTTQSGSATDALLWLKRALSFIRVFLDSVLKGIPDMTQCATIAYEATLRQYHNFLVRGIFSLAVRAVPTRPGFIEAVSPGKCSEEELLSDMQLYLAALSKNLDTINAFYATNGLDS